MGKFNSEIVATICVAIIILTSGNTIAQKTERTKNYVAFSSMPSAPNTYKISSSKDVAMKLSGTSTMHDWVMNAQTLTGEAQFNITGDKLSAVTALSFSLPVENLKSKEKAMDNNAYKALKSKKYKDIFFKLTSASVEPQQDDKYQITTVGNLSIAGVTKAITMNVYCQINNDRTITCSGSKKLKMTDYQVKPPTFLLGAMKTGDEIVLDFKLVFKK